MSTQEIANIGIPVVLIVTALYYLIQPIISEKSDKSKFIDIDTAPQLGGTQRDHISTIILTENTSMAISCHPQTEESLERIYLRWLVWVTKNNHLSKYSNTSVLVSGRIDRTRFDWAEPTRFALHTYNGTEPVIYKYDNDEPIKGRVNYLYLYSDTILSRKKWRKAHYDLEGSYEGYLESWLTFTSIVESLHPEITRLTLHRNASRNTPRITRTEDVDIVESDSWTHITYNRNTPTRTRIEGIVESMNNMQNTSVPIVEVEATKEEPKESLVDMEQVTNPHSGMLDSWD